MPYGLQRPFDAATLSFAFLLGCRTEGGVGVDKHGEDGDKALKQVALVLNVIKFHRSHSSLSL